ncbi:Fe(3+) ions import ATP-binding protein FbpC [Brevibacterium casei]|uniref:Fe(3+) ions import ATP-binding protein FbpC n=1 Tax=Brevibacterium casei TaxID=33889 RepID=A0A449D343_9MICO|nr:ABC transporter permease [Brevibacterium casei]VEW11970.1 Fe(3+) ions import ATP-binding protein FbpC [Brevibacterium casei]
MSRPTRRHSAAPRWLWIPAALGVAFLLVPIIGMVARIDLGHLGEVVTAPESLLAMGLSLLTSTIAALVSLLIGFPLGYLLATTRFRGQRLLRTLILLPLVLPPVVSGLALLYTWGRSAYLGSLLTEAGIGLAYTTAAVVFAQIFVSLPFMVMSVETAVAARGQRWELAAAELGATPARVFATITVPMLRGGILTGTVLCFARSLGEFGATLTFAGSLSGVTRTMPLQIYLVRESDPQSAIALSLLLVAAALVIIVLAYRSPHAPRLRRRAAARTDAAAPESAGARSAAPADLPAADDSDHASSVRDHPPTDRGTLSLRAVLPERGLDVAVDVPAGSTTAVIGRNGAGKTSLFEILIGALPAAAGSLRIGGTTVFDVAAGLWPPIHARGIVHLAQNPLLFPHLSVLDNVAYGLRARGEPAALARRHAADMLDRLGVGECASRQPDAVSGGQAARIALARALVVDPALLLLDEPLAALDVDVRIETRRVLKEVLRGRSALLITHDVADVTSLAETLVLIDSGRVDTVGAVGEIGHGDDTSGRDFLRSFCETDGEGILCSGSH